MDSQPKKLSKEELNHRVLELHEKGFGCRKIAAILRSEGTDIGKDTTWRICKEHPMKENTAEIDQNRGFKHLKQKEEVLRKRLDTQRKKEECRRRIVNLSVELVMTNYETRRELFLNEKKLLEFAEMVMPVIDPQLWIDFKHD